MIIIYTNEIVFLSYVMGSLGIDLFDIAHVKVGCIRVLKMYAFPILQIFNLNYRICTMWDLCGWGLITWFLAFLGLKYFSRGLWLIDCGDEGDEYPIIQFWKIANKQPKSPDFFYKMSKSGKTLYCKWIVLFIIERKFIYLQFFFEIPAHSAQ